jgi:hypothetical protein
MNVRKISNSLFPLINFEKVFSEKALTRVAGRGLAKLASMRDVVSGEGPAQYGLREIAERIGTVYMQKRAEETIIMQGVRDYAQLTKGKIRN